LKRTRFFELCIILSHTEQENGAWKCEVSKSGKTHH